MTTKDTMHWTERLRLRLERIKRLRDAEEQAILDRMPIPSDPRSTTDARFEKWSGR